MVLDLPPGPPAVQVSHCESLPVQGFEGLEIRTGGMFDTDIDGQPASAKGKDGHAASFSLIACDAPGSGRNADSTRYLDRRLDGHCRRDASSLVVMDKTHGTSSRETDQAVEAPRKVGGALVVACLR